MSKLDELEEELGTLKGSQSERSILEILTLMDSSELESRASIVWSIYLFSAQNISCTQSNQYNSINP